MNTARLLSASAVYLGLVGLGFALAPSALEFGALGGASIVIVDELRQYGGALLGIAVLNWLVRSAEPSATKRAVYIGNTVGFGLVSLGGILRQLSGAAAVGWLFVAINLCFALAFFAASRKHV